MAKNKIVDYDATLQQFFAETVKYLEKRRSRAKDKFEFDRIADAIESVKVIAKNPKKYADYTTRSNVESNGFVEAFIPAGTHDNTAYLAYSAAVNAIENLNSEYDWHRDAAQKQLLRAMKTMKYKNSANVLRDFVYPFKSLESFAVRTVDKTR